MLFSFSSLSFNVKVNLLTPSLFSLGWFIAVYHCLFSKVSMIEDGVFLDGQYYSIIKLRQIAMI